MSRTDTAKGPIAEKCAVVMDWLKLKDIPNLGMCDNFGESVEYHWRTDLHNIRVTVMHSHFSVHIHDKFTGILKSNRDFDYDKPFDIIGIEYVQVEAAPAEVALTA